MSFKIDLPAHQVRKAAVLPSLCRRRRADWLTGNICVDVCDQTVRISANLGEF